MNWNNPLPLRAKLLKPVEVGNYIGFLGAALLAWLIIQTVQEKIFLLVLTVLACGLNYFIFHLLLPDNFTQHRFLRLSSSGSLLIISGYFYLLYPYNIHLEILFIALIAGMGILSGNRTALIATGFIAVLYLFIIGLLRFFTTGLHVNDILEALFIVLAGYWTSNLAGLSHQWLLYSSRQNRYVSLLLTIGALASQQDTLAQIIPQLAQAITVELPVTTCKILLMNPDAQTLTLFGSSPLRSVEKWKGETGESLKLNDYPPIQQALQTSHYQIFSDLHSLIPTDASLVSTLAFEGAKTLGLFPLIAKGKTLGLIAVGENRAWGREPFSKEKIDLLQALAIQIAAEIDNARLFHAAHSQAQRLAVLNEVGKAIGSTIELDDLLDLIYRQLSKVIPTDTYYLALYDAEQQALDFHILIDNGKKFPPERIPLTQGLSSWVIHNRRPLLIRNLPEEIDSLPIRPIQLGQQQMSTSWLGVPVQTGERDLGIMAVASYSPYAFDENDLTLLSNIAAQAALALDNARQHAEVKEQARRDSLTRALNHGCFLKLLDESILLAHQQDAPVALIMLDIDLFKEYNDRYGHQVGDEVLRQLVQTVSTLLTAGDFIGRWGGEEFAIGLPGANLPQATLMAQSLRQRLAQIQLYNNQGQPIPSPTVSQGIAVYPQHAQDTGQLVDVADVALYRSKAAGRNQLTCA